MTRKKCIKMIMGTMGVPQPWEAEKVFRATREWMYGETGPWPSNQEVLMVILSAMAKDVAIGIPLKTYFLARVRLLIIRAKLKRIHDRLMGGPDVYKRQLFAQSLHFFPEAFWFHRVPP